MTSPDMAGGPGIGRQRYLEILVPVLSFGITLIGIVLWQQGFSLNYQYFSVGCILGSCILAYLAWIRPRRDIVALSTPVYAFIFFLVPSDDLSWIVLQLLYAASLTGLLIRLKHRFGSSAPLPGHEEVAGPLEHYIETTGRILPEVTPAIASDAGLVFIRFARGEYPSATRLAEARAKDLVDGGDRGPLPSAFTIIAEQAAQTSSGISVPASFRTFAPGEEAFLFHPADTRREREQEYSTSLDNALLLLYATALCYAGDEWKRDVSSLRKFARKLTDQK